MSEGTISKASVGEDRVGISQPNQLVAILRLPNDRRHALVHHRR